MMPPNLQISAAQLRLGRNRKERLKSLLICDRNGKKPVISSTFWSDNNMLFEKNILYRSQTTVCSTRGDLSENRINEKYLLKSATNVNFTGHRRMFFDRIPTDV